MEVILEAYRALDWAAILTYAIPMLAVVILVITILLLVLPIEAVILVLALTVLVSLYFYTSLFPRKG